MPELVPDSVGVTGPRHARRPVPEIVPVCVCLGLMLVAGFVFSPILVAGLAHPDDRAYAFEASRATGPLAAEVRAAMHRYHFPSGSGGLYDPLAAISLLLDARMSGSPQTRLFQFHLTNLCLHAVNTGLLFLLLRALGGGIFWSALLTLLFAGHPLATESIASIARRSTLLASFFSLAALLCYLRYARRLKMRWLWAVALLYAAAILSHPAFFSLPIVMLVLDVWPLRRAGLRPIVEKAPLGLIMFATIAAQLWLHSHVQPTHVAAAGPVDGFVRNISSMVARLLWPLGLAPSYPLPFASFGPGWPGLLAHALIASMPAIVVAVAFRRSWPLFAGAAVAVVLAAPYLVNIRFSDGLLADHCLYILPIAPLLAAAAWLNSNRTSAPSRRPILAAALGGAAVILAVDAYNYSFTWLTARDLNRALTHRYPSWAPGYVGMVESCIEDDELDAAVVYARRAVSLSPDGPSTQFYLGTTLLLHSDSRCAEAVEPLRRALQSNPNWIACLQNLGVALARSGHADEAIQYLERARDLQPDSTTIRTGLGHAYLQVDRSASARAEFQEALRHRNDPNIHLGLAAAWAANEVPDLARRHLAFAVGVDPRAAARAAGYPALRRLHDQPGFSSLIDLAGTGPAGNAAGGGLPAARSAGGS